MKREVFNTAWAALLSVFPSDRVTEETQRVYWEMLKEIPDDLWNEGVQDCLRQCRFFPSINELGVACCDEQKEETVIECDPWSEYQFHKRKIPSVSWQENLQEILFRRGKVKAIEELKKPEIALPKPREPERIPSPEKCLEFLRGVRAGLDEKDGQQKEKDFTERKAQLREQAKILGVDHE